MKKGFSLVGVIVAMGVASLMAYGLVQILRQSQKSTNTISQNLDFNQLQAQLFSLFQNPLTCAEAFREDGNRAKLNQNAAGLVDSSMNKLSRVTNGQELVLAAVGKKVNNNLTISAIKFEEQLDSSSNPIKFSPDSPSAGQNTFYVDLIIEATREQAYGGAVISNADQPFRLELVTDASTTQIVGCVNTSLLTGETNWVTFFPGIPGNGQKYSGGNWICNSSVSPSEYCIDQGFVSAVGNCRIFNTITNTLVEEGSILSNSDTLCGSPGWNIACLVGNGSPRGAVANHRMEILCIK